MGVSNELGLRNAILHLHIVCGWTCTVRRFAMEYISDSIGLSSA